MFIAWVANYTPLAMQTALSGPPDPWPPVLPPVLFTYQIRLKIGNLLLGTVQSDNSADALALAVALGLTGNIGLIVAVQI